MNTVLSPFTDNVKTWPTRVTKNAINMDKGESRSNELVEVAWQNQEKRRACTCREKIACQMLLDMRYHASSTAIAMHCSSCS